MSTDEKKSKRKHKYSSLKQALEPRLLFDASLVAPPADPGATTDGGGVASDITGGTGGASGTGGGSGTGDGSTAKAPETVSVVPQATGQIGDKALTDNTSTQDGGISALFVDPNANDHMATLQDFMAYNSPPKEIIFVDARVQNVAAILESASPNAEVHFIDASNNDGISQMISMIKAEQTPISAIHIVAYQADGVEYLGDTAINEQTLSEHHVQQLQNHLTQSSEVLLFASSENNGVAGEQLVSDLSRSFDVDSSSYSYMFEGIASTSSGYGYVGDTTNVFSADYNFDVLNTESITNVDTTGTELVFIDSHVENVGDLLAGISPNVKVYFLDANSDGIAQIVAGVQEQTTPISAVHILSHGDSGSLILGNSTLNEQTLRAEYSPVLESIQSYFSPNANVLLYGCDVAMDVAGEQFVMDLSHTLGVSVAASVDYTGGATYGGNWTLEYQVGKITYNATDIFDAKTLSDYTGLLANASPTLTVTSLDPTFTEAAGLGTQASAVNVFSGANASTVEAGQTFIEMRFTVSGLVNGASESVVVDGRTITLGANSSGTTTTHLMNYSVTISGGTATFVLTKSAGSITNSVMNSIINGITYRNTNTDNPTAGDRVFTMIRLKDSGGGAGATSNFSLASTVTVVPTNDAPVEASIEGSALSYTENAAATSITSTLTLSDVDNTSMSSATIKITSGYVNGQDVLSFTNTANITGSFDATTGTLTLTGTDTVANYQTALRNVKFSSGDNPTNATRTVSFTTSDGLSNSNTLTRNITVIPVNDAPVTANIEGTALSYTENAAATSITSTLTLSDVDNSNMSSATVQITSGYVNGQDILSFTNTANITGTFNAATGTLTLTGTDTVANYQAALRNVKYFNNSDNPSGATRTVSFTANDGSANSNTITRNITVIPVNDAPVVASIEGAALSYTENAAATPITSTLTLSDVDNSIMSSATVQITSGYVNGQDILSFSNTANITGSFNAATGTLMLTGTDTVANYQAALRSVTYFNNSDNPSAVTRTVSFTANDGSTNSNVATRNITVVPANDAPVTANIEGVVLAYIEKAAATPITSTLTLSDIDDSTMSSATVQITGGYQNGQDILAFTNTANITGTFNAATGILTLTGTDTVANYQAALRSVMYFNNSDNPSAATRTVSFTVNDGSANSNVATRNITVTPVNDAPVTANIEGTALAYTENDAATPITNTLSLSDVDNTSLTGATIQITDNYQNGQDILVFIDTANITGSFNATTGTLTLTGTDTVDNYQAALRSVTYFNSSDNPSAATRTVSFSVNDGSTSSNVAARSIAVTPVNDAPVTANIESASLSYTENAPAAAITSTLTLSDIDNSTMNSATIQITGNYQNGQDILAFTDTAANITGSFNATTGTLTLTGTDTVANYQAALRSVTYFNNSENPSPATRTVSFTVNDGTANSNVATRNIAVIPVNDAPVTANIEDTAMSYIENSAATPITSTLSLSDVDSVSLTSATIQITGNYQNGQDILSFTNTASITGSFNATTGTLTLTGVDTIANYEAALHNVKYFNNSDNPSAATRTVNFIVNDGLASSNVAARDIAVIPVNDAPITANIEGAALSYTENAAATPITSTLTLSDVDNSTMSRATIQIASGYQNGQDILAFSDTANITGTFNAATGMLTLIGSDTVANYQAALRSVTYFNNSDNPNTATRVVSFTVNDGSTNSNLATRDINVIAVNDVPVTANIEGEALSYTENAAATAITSTLTLSDIDNTSLSSATIQITSGYQSGEDILAFTNTSNITGSFNATTGTLTLTGSDTLANYQSALRSVTYFNNSNNPSAATRTVTFRVNDGSANSNAATRDIVVIPVNDAPVTANIEAAALSYTENDGLTAITDTLSLSDMDSISLAGATIQITGNYQNGEDILSFANTSNITGSFNAATGTLTLSGIDTLANYESALHNVMYFNNSDNPSSIMRTVSIAVNDGSVSSNIATRNIAVIPVNDAPVTANIEGGVLSYTENASATPITSTLTLSDVDNSTMSSATVQITSNYQNGQDILAFTDTANITGSFNAETGTLTLTGTDTIANYQAALHSVTYFNNSNSPSVAIRTVSFAVTDGSASSNIATRNISVIPVNDAPVTAAIESTTLSYTENAGPMAITDTLTLSDVDNSNLSSATVRITGNYQNGQDILAFTDTGNIAGSFNATTGTLTLTGSDTIANYQAALRSVTYFNNSGNPSTATRVVSITVNDGSANSNVATRDISVVAVNDAPVAANIEVAALSYIENAVATPITSTLTLSDVDNTHLASAIIQITGNYQNGQDILAFANTGNITGSFDATTGILTLTGSDTLANYQAALRSVTYFNNSDNPSSAVRTISFTVNDDISNSNLTIRSINVIPVNDAPVTTNIENTALIYTENAAATAITNTLSLSDVDSTHLSSATIQISNNYQTGEDVLVFTDTANITGSFNAVTGTLTLTGSDTLANYETALHNVRYFNNSDNPSIATRVVTFTVNDGVTNSNAATRDISVIAVNDAPQTANIENTTLVYMENALATPITHTLSLSDIDSSTLAGATVQITGNYQNGQDILTFANTATITGSFNAATGTLTLTGVDTVANYQAALRSVMYINSNNDPNANLRTISFSVNDGSEVSNVATRNVSVVPINDAPVITVTAIDGTAESTSPVQIFNDAIVSTIESGQMIKSLTWNVSNVFDGATEQVNIDGTNILLSQASSGTTIGHNINYTVTPNGNVTTIEMNSNSGMDSADVNNMINSMTYRNVSPTPTAGVRTFALLQAVDTGGTANGGLDTAHFSLASTVTVLAPTTLVPAPLPPDTTTSLPSTMSGTTVAPFTTQVFYSGNNVLSATFRGAAAVDSSSMTSAMLGTSNFTSALLTKFASQPSWGSNNVVVSFTTASSIINGLSGAISALQGDMTSVSSFEFEDSEASAVKAAIDTTHITATAPAAVDTNAPANDNANAAAEKPAPTPTNTAKAVTYSAATIAAILHTETNPDLMVHPGGKNVASADEVAKHPQLAENQKSALDRRTHFQQRVKSLLKDFWL